MLSNLSKNKNLVQQCTFQKIWKIERTYCFKAIASSITFSGLASDLDSDWSGDFGGDSGFSVSGFSVSGLTSVSVVVVVGSLSALAIASFSSGLFVLVGTGLGRLNSILFLIVESSPKEAFFSSSSVFVSVSSFDPNSLSMESKLLLTGLSALFNSLSIASKAFLKSADSSEIRSRYSCNKITTTQIQISR